MDLNELQFAFFFKEPTQLAYDELSYKFKQNISQLNSEINFETTIFPLPSGVPIPSEVPRCQIISSDQKLKITFSLDRCDINCGFDKSFGHIYTSEYFYNVVNIIFKLISVKIDFKRYGHIANFFKVINNPKEVIAEKLIKPKIKSPIADTFVNFGTIELLEKFSLNKIYQFRSAVKQNFSNGRAEEIIFIIKDFNTSENSIANKTLFNDFISETKDIIKTNDIQEYLE